MRKFLLSALLLATPLTSDAQLFIYPFPQELLYPDPFPEPEEKRVELMAGTLREEILQKSKTLEQKLKRKIFGQDEAVQETTNAIIRYAAGVNDPTAPIASLLYCGPSGVGKTELAKQLSIELYGKRSHFVRINMSEYTEAHTISRLIGAPPGYIGYGEGGSLTNRLLDNPYSVVLLDEVEKAHPKVLKLFMHVFDAGYLTSSTGQDVDCRHAIFILTSNIASAEIADLFSMGLTQKEILMHLQPHLMEVLSPELYNRLDCMIFAPLTEAVFEKLIRKILGELKTRISQSKAIDICFDQSIVDYLKNFTLDPKLGARPLKRIVEKELTTVIAKAIVDSECKPGDGIICSYEKGNIVIEVVLTPIDG